MALNLVSATVLKDNTNAYLDGDIVLTFDQNIDSATVTDSTVILYLLPNYNPYSIKRTVTDNKITITPNPFPLARNSSFELLVVSGANGVKSLTAEQITSNIITPFATQELLAPTDPPAEPATVIDNYSNIQGTIGDPTTILVPDVNIQGEIVPFKPCTPDGFGSVDIEYTASGIPVTLTGSAMLKSSGSDPEPYSIGITDISQIIIYWPEDILLVGTPPIVELTYEDLNWPFSPYTKTAITIDSVIAVGNQLVIATSGAPADLTNLEFTLTIKALKIQSVDGVRTNGVEKYNWMGTLDPLLCTIEMAQSNAGLWGEALTEKDVYNYTKMMYLHSITALRGSGYTSLADLQQKAKELGQDANQILYDLSKYVCCSTALDMLTDSVAGAKKGTQGSRSGLFVKKRSLPGVSVEYDNFFSSAAVGKNATGSPAQEALKKLMECINDHKPKDERLMENGGPMAIATGVKSIYDTSLSIPGRRRL